MKTNKMTKAFSGALAALMLITSLPSLRASADDSMITAFPSTAYFFERDFKRAREETLEQLQKENITIVVGNYALYHAKNIKVYGRRAVGVDDNGNYIYSGWEQLNENDDLYAGYKLTFEAVASYMQFAFSYDITWGTDYPYSGVFWTNDKYVYYKDIEIDLGGTCRMASTKIWLGNNKIVDEFNCSSHTEWKP